MKRGLKFFHEIGTFGVMGAVAAQIVLASLARDLSPEQFAMVRDAIRAITRFLLLPSLGLVLLSGLLALGATRAFHDADWAIVKALMTPLVFEATVLMVDRPARTAAELAAKWAAGDASVRPALDRVLAQERWGLWIVLAVYTINVVLSIWRPRRRRKPPATEPTAKETGSGPTTEPPREPAPAN